MLLRSFVLRLVSVCRVLLLLDSSYQLYISSILQQRLRNHRCCVVVVQ